MKGYKENRRFYVCNHVCCFIPARLKQSADASISQWFSAC